MKRLLILILLVLAGCREQTLTETLNSVKDSRTITDRQAETLSKVGSLFLNSLTSITNEQAESLSTVKHLELNSLTSITDQQAESLSQCKKLHLNGLTSITDLQAESLGKVEGYLLYSVSVEGYLSLNGLTSITDAQAESLSKVESLHISEALQPLIDKYKQQ